MRTTLARFKASFICLMIMKQYFFLSFFLRSRSHLVFELDIRNGRRFTGIVAVDSPIGTRSNRRWQNINLFLLFISLIIIDFFLATSRRQQEIRLTSAGAVVNQISSCTVCPALSLILIFFISVSSYIRSYCLIMHIRSHRGIRRFRWHSLEKHRQLICFISDGAQVVANPPIQRHLKWHVSLIV